MSMWQFFTAVEGCIEKEPGKMSSSEADEIWQWMQEKNGSS